MEAITADLPELVSYSTSDQNVMVLEAIAGDGPDGTAVAARNWKISSIRETTKATLVKMAGGFGTAELDLKTWHHA
jgi:hypothetical protein